MSRLKGILTTEWGPAIAGGVIGVLTALLSYFGNPGNMGICVVCFSGDIAAAIGLQPDTPVPYIRPEIIGFVLGSCVAALLFREFRARTGSAPIVRFFLGMLATIGALVFIGCPWRAYLRLAGGDWNAIPGIAGLVIGIGLGSLFIKGGFGLGRSHAAPQAVGWVMPVLMLALLGLALALPEVPTSTVEMMMLNDPSAGCDTGLGAQHAPLAISLAFGLIIGFLSQRTSFCTMSAWRNLFLTRNTRLLKGVLALVLTALLTNLALGMFHAGWRWQPVAHTDTLANLMSMVLAGLALTLAGGCPGRQLFLAGEGDADAGMFVLGMFVGAALAHNLNLVSSVSGPQPHAMQAVSIGLVCCLVIGLSMREPLGS